MRGLSGVQVGMGVRIVFDLKEMGLDYLNKKIWHPGSMKNIQKVWEVEQVQHELNKKSKERAKKLIEERHNDELKRIQVEAGLIPRSHLDRMDWMYDWGNKIHQQQKTNEEYLTGKKQAARKENKHVFQEEVTNKKCEDFTFLYEDPMFQIQKQEKARKDALMNNPIEMRNIIKEVELQYLPKDSPVASERSKSKTRDSKKKHRRELDSSDSERSRSRDRQGGYKQSAMYKQYLKDRFGGILKKEENGNLKPDYSIHRTKYRTEYQKQDDERRKRNEHLRDMRDNAVRLQELKMEGVAHHSDEEQPCNQEEGVVKLRGSLFETVKKNRNHKRYKEESD